MDRLRGRLMVLVVSSIVVLVAPAAPVAADNREAASIFRAGQSAFARGDYRAAAAAFEQAATVQPNADAWFFAGDSWQRAGDEARAVFAMDQALALGLSEPRASNARTQLASLRPRLCKVRIEGPEGGRIAVANVRDAALPAEVYLPAGEHAVRLIAGPGAGAYKSVVAALGETAQVSFPAPVEPQKAATMPAPAPARKESAERTTLVPAPAPLSPLVVIGWSSIGLGASAGVAAIVLGTQGLSARDEWEADRRDLELRDRAEGLRLATNIAWAGAGILTASGVALVVAAAVTRPATAPRMSLVLSPEAARAVVRW